MQQVVLRQAAALSPVIRVTRRRASQTAFSLENSNYFDRLHAESLKRYLGSGDARLESDWVTS